MFSKGNNPGAQKLPTMTTASYTLANGATIAIPTQNEDSKGNTFAVEHKVWEKDGKRRVYVSAVFAKSGKVDCGFVDLNTGAANLKSSPAWIAQYISSDIA